MANLSTFIFITASESTPKVWTFNEIYCNVDGRRRGGCFSFLETFPGVFLPGIQAALFPTEFQFGLKPDCVKLRVVNQLFDF